MKAPEGSVPYQPLRTRARDSDNLFWVQVPSCAFAPQPDATPYVSVHRVLDFVLFPVKLRRELFARQRLLVVCLAPNAIALVQRLRLGDLALAQRAAILDPARHMILVRQVSCGGVLHYGRRL